MTLNIDSFSWFFKTFFGGILGIEGVKLFNIILEEKKVIKFNCWVTGLMLMLNDQFKGNKYK